MPSTMPVGGGFRNSFQIRWAIRSEPAARLPREALRPHDSDQQDRGGDQHDEADQGEQERTRRGG